MQSVQIYFWALTELNDGPPLGFGTTVTYLSVPRKRKKTPTHHRPSMSESRWVFHWSNPSITSSRSHPSQVITYAARPTGHVLEEPPPAVSRHTQRLNGRWECRNVVSEAGKPGTIHAVVSILKMYHGPRQTSASVWVKRQHRKDHGWLEHAAVNINGRRTVSRPSIMA
ncbi:hypothetical protein MHYP_G00001220 [Metynnis hypsauchen]